ncbi:hypothetical protein FHS22_007438 [Planomonospora venezuelensis]|uniref:Uncharacterized protein n=1 Tax=Planomonospora venezuelensis TaxID=1999 RepID=A0A841DF58_PLAVE|nr:hypothetical protein [Planomonospora venezuelensis]
MELSGFVANTVEPWGAALNAFHPQAAACLVTA